MRLVLIKNKPCIRYFLETFSKIKSIGKNKIKFLPKRRNNIVIQESLKKDYLANCKYSFLSNNLYEFRKQIDTHSESIENACKYQKAIELYLEKCERNFSFFHGYCEVCDRYVDFEISNIFDKREKTLNWRETLKCPYCRLNNRQRMVIDIIGELVNRNDSIYITEYMTHFYFFLKQRYKNIIGSEFLGADKEGGKRIKGIRHENILGLSFSDNSLDAVVTCDVLEHVYDYPKAINEVYRCLKKDGFYIFTVPFLYNSEEDEVRTIIKNGNMEFIMEPEIHGNPINKEGSLVFTIPGWRMFKYIKSIGFRDAYAKFMFSLDEGHFAYGSGVPQVVFVARK